MATVKLYKPKENKSYDITEALASYSWSGATLSAGRTLEIDYVNAPYDSNVKVPQISLGDFVALLSDSGQEIFFGQLYGIERSSNIGTISYTAYDAMKNLLESSGKYNFKNRTPEAITVQVCTDLGIPTGTLAPTGINIKSLLADEKSIYDIIMEAYTKAHVIDGKYYMALIWNRMLNVYESNYYVANFELSDDLNISSASITENVDSLQNKIKIYDENGKQIGEVKDDDSISTFGVFQGIYTKEKNVNPQTGATAKLSSKPTQKISISAIGDINCLSGYNVMVKDSATGVHARYWIISDKHTWSDGNHMMDLELQFDRIMDQKES